MVGTKAYCFSDQLHDDMRHTNLLDCLEHGSMWFLFEVSVSIATSIDLSVTYSCVKWCISMIGVYVILGYHP